MQLHWTMHSMSCRPCGSRLPRRQRLLQLCQLAWRRRFRTLLLIWKLPKKPTLACKPSMVGPENDPQASQNTAIYIMMQNLQ